MSAELEDIHEECGIFGVWGHSDAARLTYFGLHALQHRGQEGAGIVSNDNGHLIGHRGTGLLTQVFSDEREIKRLKGDRAIGHVRYATAGSGGTDNIQPFIFRFHDGDMALCHNGNLTNCLSLRRKLEDEGAIFHSNSDTEVLMHLIRRSTQRTFMDKLKEALNIVHGGFAYLIMTENAMIGALDPNGFRPLSLGKMKNGAYVLASETCALDVVGAELVRNIRPGEIVKIPTGIRAEMNEGWVLAVFPRSSLGFKYRLQLNNTVGIIDSDYFYSDNEGHIFAKLTNDSNEGKTVELEAGSGFMQGIFVEYGITMDDDVTTVRNGGFGSTSQR